MVKDIKDAEGLLQFVAEESIVYVDFRFTDYKGKWHHVSYHNSVLDEDPTDSKEPEEGGAEEGRSLTPLKRHIVTDLDNSVASTAADDEDGETVQQADTASAPETTDKRGRQLPSWATK